MLLLETILPPSELLEVTRPVSSSDWRYDNLIENPITNNPITDDTCYFSKQFFLLQNYSKRPDPSVRVIGGTTILSRTQ